MKKERPFELCAPFRFDRLYGDEKYSLQNMLLREVNMPSVAYPGELVYEAWSDHVRNAFWDNANLLLKSTMTADAFFAGVDNESFLRWANAVFSEVNGKSATWLNLTGAAIVRFTNVASGYPTLRLTGIIATQNLEFRRYGITRPERVTMSIDGYYEIEEQS
jgi:hypothetical protein